MAQRCQCSFMGRFANLLARKRTVGDSRQGSTRAMVAIAFASAFPARSSQWRVKTGFI